MGRAAGDGRDGGGGDRRGGRQRRSGAGCAGQGYAQACRCGGRVTDTVDRTALWRVQTPQVFARRAFCEAMQAAVQAGEDMTDDCQLMERAGYPVQLCPAGRAT